MNNKANLISSGRHYFLDYVRVFLTFLVVLHHWAIANGGPGDWYVTDSNLNEKGAIVLSIFVAVNQAFFMGLFFFISAYLTEAAYEKNGWRIFLKKRLVRLGVPLLFFTFLLSPLIKFLVKFFETGITFSDFFALGKGLFNQGPLWFVQLLLVFNIIYVLYREIRNPSGSDIGKTGISIRSMIVFVIILILTTYFTRIVFPVGNWLPVINVQLAHFFQYVLFFGAGIIAKRQHLLENLEDKQVKVSIWISMFLIVVVFPSMFLLSGTMDQIELFMGGATWHSLAYSIWEQLLGVFLSISVLGVFRNKFYRANTFVLEMARSSYAIYIFHSLILVVFTLLFRTFPEDSFYKFVLLGPIVLSISFLFAKFVRSFKIIRNII